jgi:hypothetical protein
MVSFGGVVGESTEEGSKGIPGGVGGSTPGGPGIAPEGETSGEATEEKVGGGGKSSFGAGTYDPQKDYSSVQMTQGEVLQDDDWNEESEVVDPITREGMMKKIEASFEALDEMRQEGLEDMRDIQAVKEESLEKETERLKDKYGSDDPRTPPPEEVSTESLHPTEAQIPLNVPIETPQEDLMADPNTLSPTGHTDSDEGPFGGGKTHGGDKDGSKGGISGTTSPGIPTSDPEGESPGGAQEEDKGGSVDDTTETPPPPKDSFDTGEPSGGGEAKGGTQSGSKGSSGPISGTSSPGVPATDPQGETSGGAKDEGKGGATGETTSGPPKDGVIGVEGGSGGGVDKGVSGGVVDMSIDLERGIIVQTDEGDDDVMVDPSQAHSTEDDEDDGE